MLNAEQIEVARLWLEQGKAIPSHMAGDICDMALSAIPPDEGGAEQINGFLCMASSDGDPPITALVPTFIELQRFIEQYWFGEKPSEMTPDNLEWYCRECARIKRDLGSDGECHIDFEDGWVGFRTILYLDHSLAQPPAGQAKVTEEMVSRFLCWPLPKDFAPDCGISFDGRKDDEWNKGKTWPIGTNLLTATQARAMLEYVLPAAPSARHTEQG